MTEQQTPHPPATQSVAPSAIAPTPVPPPVMGEAPFSHAQPVWQFVLLYLCTFSLYELVWFYRNWHLLKKYRELRVTPLVRAIFAPLFSWSFYNELQQLMGRHYPWGMPPVWLATLFFVSHVLANATGRLSELPDAPAMLGLIPLIFLIASTFMLLPAVRAINAFWEAEEPGHRMRTSLSGGAIAVVVIGGLFWVLMLIGLVVGNA